MSGPCLTDVVPVVVKEALESDGSELRCQVERAVEGALPLPAIGPPPSSIAAYHCTDFQVGHKIFINEVSLKVDALPQTTNTQQESKDSICLKKGINKKKVLVSGVLLLAIATAVSISIFVDFHPSETIERGVREESSVDGSFVEKEVWRGSERRGRMKRLEVPVPYVVIAHTASPPCFSIPQCSTLLRNMQEAHFSMGFSDIGYNFMVGGDGGVYVGRGWGWEGAHTKGANPTSIGLGLIGNFVNSPPPHKQINAVFNIIRQGLQLEKLSPNYKILAQNQIKTASASPGAALIELMQTWPHKATSYP